MELMELQFSSAGNAQDPFLIVVGSVGEILKSYQYHHPISCFFLPAASMQQSALPPLTSYTPHQPGHTGYSRSYFNKFPSFYQNYFSISRLCGRPEYSNAIPNLQ
jgi:hypothetical protein